MDVEEIVKFSEKKASEIFRNTEAIREDFRKGRPNSSDESTTKGVLEAMEAIVSALPNDFLEKNR